MGRRRGDRERKPFLEQAACPATARIMRHPSRIEMVVKLFAWSRCRRFSRSLVVVRFDDVAFALSGAIVSQSEHERGKGCSELQREKSSK